MRLKRPLLPSILFFIISFTTSVHAQVLDFVNPPSPLIIGTTVNIQLNFTSKSENPELEHLIVRLKNPDGTNGPQMFIQPTLNQSSHTFNFTVPSDLSPGTYAWQAQTLKADWGEIVTTNIENIAVQGDTPNPEQDFIDFVNPPMNLTPGSQINVRVNFTSRAQNPEVGYVLIRLKNPDDTNGPQDFIVPTTNQQSHTFNFTVPEGIADGVYKWQAQLLKSNWGGLDTTDIENVVIGDDTTPGGTSIALTNVPDAIALGESYDVGVSYQVTQNSVIYVQIFDGETTDANGNWNKIGSGSVAVNPGSSTITVPNIFVDRDVAPSNRLEVLLFHPGANGWGDPVDIGNIFANIPGVAGEVFGEQDPSDPSTNMRYYDRQLEGGIYNGNNKGPLTGEDHTLAPTSNLYRSNWWVNANWKGPIKSHYGEDAQNGQNFWVEWQNLGAGFSGHGEFDIRVEKSNRSLNGPSYGLPSRLGDITEPLNCTFTGRWTAGSTGRGHINMTAWVYNSLDPDADRDPNASRCDIIIHAWDNSGDFKRKFEINYEWANPNSNTIFYFNKIGTASANGITYDVLRTMPGGFGEGASYNLIPSNWPREFITDFPTGTINATIDVNKILKDIIALEEANGPDIVTDQLGNSYTANLLNDDWGLHVMEWTITGQSGAEVHDPSSENFDDKVYVPNSKGRFTIEQYFIPNPCASNPNFPCPVNATTSAINEDSASAITPNRNQEIRVSPNPFGETVSYDYTVRKANVVTVELYTLSGRKIRTLQDPDKQPAGNYTDIVDTSDLKPGLYIIKITTNGDAISKMLIKK